MPSATVMADPLERYPSEISLSVNVFLRLSMIMQIYDADPMIGGRMRLKDINRMGYLAVMAKLAIFAI